MHRIILDGIAHGPDGFGGKGFGGEDLATRQERVLASGDAGFTHDGRG